jgi:hypothetical protein
MKKQINIRGLDDGAIEHISKKLFKPESKEDWEMKHYRFCENLLNKFKRKEIGYTQFIDLEADFIRDEIKNVLDKINKEIQKLIIDEILIAQMEGQPTSRLTSLSNKLNHLK